MPNYNFDRALCEPVVAKQVCRNCGWSTDNDRYLIGKDEEGGDAYSPKEPHIMVMSPIKVGEIKARCANCGAAYNLDGVACSECHFEPMADEMYEKLREEKNAYLKRQFRPIIPPRAKPAQVNMAKDAPGPVQPKV